MDWKKIGVQGTSCDNPTTICSDTMIEVKERSFSATSQRIEEMYRLHPRKPSMTLVDISIPITPEEVMARGPLGSKMKMVPSRSATPELFNGKSDLRFPDMHPFRRQPVYELCSPAPHWASNVYHDNLRQNYLLPPFRPSSRSKTPVKRSRNHDRKLLLLPKPQKLSRILHTITNRRRNKKRMSYSAPSSEHQLQSKRAVYAYGEDDSRVAYDFIVRRDNQLHRSRSFPCVEVKGCWEPTKTQPIEAPKGKRRSRTMTPDQNHSLSMGKAEGDFWAPQEPSDEGGFSEMSARVKKLAKLDVNSIDKNAIKERSNLFQSMFTRPANFFNTIGKVEDFPKPDSDSAPKPKKLIKQKPKMRKPSSQLKVAEMGLLTEREHQPLVDPSTPNETSGGSFDTQSDRILGFQYSGKLKKALVDGDSETYLEEIEKLEDSNTNIWKILSLPIDSSMKGLFELHNGDTPLHHFARVQQQRKNKRMVRWLVRLHPELLDIKNEKGETPADILKSNLAIYKLFQRSPRSKETARMLESLGNDFGSWEKALTEGSEEARLLKAKSNREKAFKKWSSVRFKVRSVLCLMEIFRKKMRENVAKKRASVTQTLGIEPINSPAKDTSNTKLPPCASPKEKPAGRLAFDTKAAGNRQNIKFKKKLVSNTFSDSPPSPCETLIFKRRSKRKSRERLKAVPLVDIPISSPPILPKIKNPSVLRKLSMIHWSKGNRFEIVGWKEMHKRGPLYSARSNRKRRYHILYPHCTIIKEAVEVCTFNQSSSRRTRLITRKEQRSWAIPNVLPIEVLKKLRNVFEKIDINRSGIISRVELSSQQRFMIVCTAQDALDDVEWLFSITSLRDDMNWNTLARFWNLVSINFGALSYVKEWIEENEPFQRQFNPTHIFTDQLTTETDRWFVQNNVESRFKSDTFFVPAKIVEEKKPKCRMITGDTVEFLTAVLDCLKPEW